MNGAYTILAARLAPDDLAAVDAALAGDPLEHAESTPGGAVSAPQPQPRPNLDRDSPERQTAAAGQLALLLQMGIQPAMPGA